MKVMNTTALSKWVKAPGLSPVCTHALAAWKQTCQGTKKKKRRITWWRFREQSGSESSSTSRPFAQRSIPLCLREVTGRLETLRPQNTDLLPGRLKKAKRLVAHRCIRRPRWSARSWSERKRAAGERDILNFMASERSRSRVQSLVHKTRWLTGFMPVSMPTYPAKFVDLKTVLLFLLKSRLTTRGFSISEMIQDLFLVSQLEEAQVCLIMQSL